MLRGDFMKVTIFKNALTVRELKEIIKDWPEEDANGNPCEVWIGDKEGTSNQVKEIWPLNMRESEDGSKKWADILLDL